MTLFVTGTTGYIGARLIMRARAQGYSVLAGTRRAPADGSDWLLFDIQDDTEIVLPPTTRAVIHLASNTDFATLSSEAEVIAAKRLLAAAGRVGARFVFVSSPDRPRGRANRLWSQQVADRTDCCGSGRIYHSAWPGSYGGPERGLFGVLCNATRQLPVLPAFWPAPGIQPVHVDDLAEVLLRCAINPPQKTLLCIGAETQVSFTAFLRSIAWRRLGRVKAFLPVPAVLVRLAARLLGSRGSGAARLVSLFDLPRMETCDDLAALNLTLRPLDTGMSRSGLMRRALLP